MIDITWTAAITIILSLAGAGILAFILYRSTTPTLPPRLRVILGILRWLAIVLVLLMVLDPVVRLTRTIATRPIVVLLVDDSKSMAYGQEQPKLGQVKSALSERLIDLMGEKADLRFFTFSDETGEIGREGIRAIEARGSRTDLVGALRSVLDHMDGKPSAFVVMTDGGFNFGEDALHFCSSLTAPVYTISVAGDRRTPDVLVDRVETSEIAYAGSEVPVEIYLSGIHSEAMEAQLTVSDTTGQVFSTQVTLPGTGARRKIVANVDAGETGVHKFRVDLDSFEGEAVRANNSMDFSIKVMKGKVKVCLVAPGPSWDLAFARRSLNRDPNTDMYILFVGRGGTGIKSEKVIRNLDEVLPDLDAVVVFEGTRLGSAADTVKRFVWEGGGLLLISPEAGQDLAHGMCPFDLSAGREAGTLLYEPQITDAGRDHEILRFGMQEVGDLWSELPPVPIHGLVDGPIREAMVLLSGVNRQSVLPLVAVMRYGEGRIVGLSAFDLWRWDLVPKGFGIETSAFSELLLSSIRWFTEREELRLLSISTTRNDYLWGEPVDILARVMDKDLKPRLDTDVTARIYDRASGDVVREIALTDRGGGSHSERVDLLMPSRYTLRAVASIDGRSYSEESVDFSVDERGLEDWGFDGDNRVLEQIAGVTGGGFYRIGKMSTMLEDLNPGSVIERQSREIRFRPTLGSLILLACLLGVEWLIRKRRMLP
jgi:hypothetical protein